MLIQAPQREYRTWAIDSRRWAYYRPRPNDIIVATYPKCGTTWMQRAWLEVEEGHERRAIVMDLLALTLESRTREPAMNLSEWEREKLIELLYEPIFTIQTRLPSAMVRPEDQPEYQRLCALMTKLLDNGHGFERVGEQTQWTTAAANVQTFRW